MILMDLDCGLFLRTIPNSLQNFDFYSVQRYFIIPQGNIDVLVSLTIYVSLETFLSL